MFDANRKVVLQMTLGILVAIQAVQLALVWDASGPLLENSAIYNPLPQSARIVLATGQGKGGTSLVKLFGPGGNALYELTTYHPLTTAVRVAVGDVNGDGIDDLITGAGAGVAPEVKVFSGKDHTILSSFMAYGSTFTGGVFVASGDVNHDGVDDIITGAGAGGGSYVKVFNGKNNQAIRSFLAYGATFRGGVQVAAGDVNGDGYADIIAGAGPGGGPRVIAFSGVNNAVLANFMAYGEGFRGGVFVAAGDIDGDGSADIITGPGATGGPHVKVFSGKTKQVLASFMAYGPTFVGGVRVAAADFNADGLADIITGAGAGGGPHVKVFNGKDKSLLKSFYAYDAKFTGGVFVAGRHSTNTQPVIPTKPIPPRNEKSSSSVSSTSTTAKLSVAVNALPTGDTAVRSQKDINLLRFTARPENGDIRITATHFIATIGSVLNVSNYTLWVDTDGDGKVDTILQKGVGAISGKVDFMNLVNGGYSMHAVSYFEVHADVNMSLTSRQLELGFDASNAKYIEAERTLDGVDLSGIATNGTCQVASCDIVTSLMPSEIWSFVDQGSLFVTKDPTPARNRQLLGGTIGDPILRLRLHAEAEDIDVTSLNFGATDGIPSLGTDVDRLDLYKEGETQPFASATSAYCGQNPPPGVQMCAYMISSQLVVPRGIDVTILVRPRMKTDTDGGISGHFFALLMNADGGTVKARGIASQNNVIYNDGDSIDEGEIFIGTSSPAPSVMISGNKNNVVMSKITSITNANPDANGTNVPTGVSELAAFRFTAAPNLNSKNGYNKVALGTVMFNLNVQNVAINPSSFTGYDTANASAHVGCSALNLNGSTASSITNGGYLISCAFSGSPVDNMIDQGTDKTFALRANVTNPKVSGASPSALQVSLQNFSNSTFTTFGPSASHMTWQDVDVGNSAVFYWVEHPETVIKSTAYAS